DPQRRHQLSLRAQAHAQQFIWENKADHLVALYQAVLQATDAPNDASNDVSNDIRKGVKPFLREHALHGQ
ncbi:MAG: hypothetical protein AAFU71_17315, partial [Cyanobacteria bacterium J06632_22]